MTRARAQAAASGLGVPMRLLVIGILGLLAVLAGTGTGTGAASAREIVVTDVEGREVRLPDRPRRILLGEGHLLVAMALLDPDPARDVVAWQGDLKRHSPAIFDRFVEKFPAVADIPVVGDANPESFSVEQALAALPDIAILSGSYGPSIRSTEVVRKLEAAGVPVVFVDFFTDPRRNTLPSIRILGRILGQEERAEAYAAFYEERLRRIADRLAEADPERPSIHLRAFAGVWDCCWIPGGINLGSFIEMAGGRNPGSDLFPDRPWGQVPLETVFVEDPDVFVTTGNPHVATMGGLVLGVGVRPEEARDSLAGVLGTTGVAELTAVRNGRAHGLWHLFHDLPINIVAIEALAKWLHPRLFADIDPEATMAEINERFLAVPLEGTFTVDAE